MMPFNQVYFLIFSRFSSYNLVQIYYLMDLIYWSCQRVRVDFSILWWWQMRQVDWVRVISYCLRDQMEEAEVYLVVVSYQLARASFNFSYYIQDLYFSYIFILFLRVYCCSYKLVFLIMFTLYCHYCYFSTNQSFNFFTYITRVFTCYQEDFFIIDFQAFSWDFQISYFYQCRIQDLTTAFSYRQRVFILYIFQLRCRDRIWFYQRRTFTWCQAVSEVEERRPPNKGGRVGATEGTRGENVSNADRLWNDGVFSYAAGFEGLAVDFYIYLTEFFRFVCIFYGYCKQGLVLPDGDLEVDGFCAVRISDDFIYSVVLDGSYSLLLSVIALFVLRLSYALAFSSTLLLSVTLLLSSTLLLPATSNLTCGSVTLLLGAYILGSSCMRCPSYYRFRETFITSLGFFLMLLRDREDVSLMGYSVGFGLGQRSKGCDVPVCQEIIVCLIFYRYWFILSQLAFAEGFIYLWAMDRLVILNEWKLFW